MKTVSTDGTKLAGSRLALIVVVQLLLVGGAAAGVAYRSWQLDQRAALPALREVPLLIEPRFDEPRLVDAADLVTALWKLRPRKQGDEAKVGNIDHNLRFGGAEAKFDDADVSDGAELRELLTDDRKFRALYKERGESKPLLIDLPAGGVRVRDLEGALSSPHNDHLMATLAEIGTPLSFPITTARGQTTYRAIVEQALRDFSLNQQEYEWSAVTFALLVRDSRWITSEGQEVSFDLLADRIMRQDMPQGVCMGNHRLHALVLLLRVNEVWDGPEPMLSPAAEARIVEFLQQNTAKLTAHQHADGFWNIDWPTKTPESRTPTDRQGDDLGSRIIATGHTLEWWALVPDKYRGDLVPDSSAQSAAQWLVRTINELSDDQVLENSSFLSHAGRALALWRGKFPHQVDLKNAREKVE